MILRDQKRCVNRSSKEGERERRWGAKWGEREVVGFEDTILLALETEGWALSQGKQAASRS